LNTQLSEDQAFFRDTTRKFLESELPLTVVRDLWENTIGFDRGLWRRAAELGWTSAYIPEGLGGGSVSGNPLRDAVIVAEEMGRMVSPGPFLPVNVVAAAIASDGSPAQQRDLLAPLLTGDAIATWALTEPGARWDGACCAIATMAVPDRGDIVVNGLKAYVEATAAADWFLVAARAPAGLTQVVVPADAPGVTVLAGRSIDITRRYGSVRFDEVRLPASAVLGEIGGAASSVERQLQIALTLQCAETVGAADRVFETTVEYSLDRFAFGRPIASFQAIKHRVADMLQWLEFSKAISDGAARAVDTVEEEAPQLVSVAKAYTADRCLDLVDDCVQINGGIGVTWEHDIHLYSRRLAVNRATLGTPEQHKERLCVLLSV
jgi:alkylation response protein AidB-like acyl-CoA dehydrogenase